MRAQVSVELLVIVGIVLVLFIPILILVYSKADEANQRLASFQSAVAQARLINTVNAVGSLGAGAHVLTEVYLPPHVEQIEFLSLGDGGEIVFRVRQGDREMALADVVKFPLDASPITPSHEGLYRFNISNSGEHVAVQLLSQ